MIEFGTKIVSASNINGNFPVPKDVMFAKTNNNKISASDVRKYWRDLVEGGTPQY